MSISILAVNKIPYFCRQTLNVLFYLHNIAQTYNLKEISPRLILTGACLKRNKPIPHNPNIYFNPTKKK